MEQKTCPLCMGISVAAPKEVRDSWKKRYFDALAEVEKGAMPADHFDKVKREIDFEMEMFGACKWCAGEGTVPVTDRDRKKDAGKPGLGEGEEWKQ